MKAIFQPSVLASGCPQSTSHHYAFMPDLCDVGDVAASFLSALQDRKQRLETIVNLSFCCISAATTNTEAQIHDNVSGAALTRSSCSNRPARVISFPAVWLWVGRADAKVIYLWTILSKWIFLPFNIHIYFSISFAEWFKEGGRGSCSWAMQPVRDAALTVCAVLVKLVQAHAEWCDCRRRRQGEQ